MNPAMPRSAMAAVLIALSAASALSPASAGTADHPVAPTPVVSVAAQQDASPARLVDPFVGTLADFGQLSPAAVAPFGMVQLGPDTAPANHAGYDFAATLLRGFSHTRGVGVGCGGAGGDLLAMLEYEGAPDLASMDKAGERAHAGYYRLTYGNGIEAQLTATRGAGIIRFRLPHAGRVILKLDPNHGYAKRISAHWLTTAAADLRGELRAGTVCDVGAYRLFTASRLLHNGRPVTAPLAFDDKGLATLRLDVRAGDVVELRTGLSSVDADGAADVLARETGDRPFGDVAGATQAAWDGALSRISIDGATRDERALFVTALFRTLQTPVAIADPDGRYRGSDGAIKRVVPGHQRYTSWAMWDNYRTLMPLLALIAPDRAADIARSLVELYGEGKHRWATQAEPFLSVRTEHSGVALLDFFRKGLLSRADAQAALRGMIAESPTLARATPDEQIEAAYDDWAIAELAGDLGEAETARRFREQALSYRAMWRQVFATLGEDADVVKARGLYQGTLWQYRWAPVFDLPWLVETLGAARFDAELNAFFARGLFNMTNQPDMQAPFLPAWRGDAAESGKLVHGILTRPIDHWYTNAGKRPAPWHGRSFALAPQGFADGMDDDAGAMSAWYVFAVMGLYPLTPGDPHYVAIRPAYTRLTLHRDHAPPIMIERPSDAEAAQGVITRINGRALRAPTVEHGALTAGMAGPSASGPRR